MKFLNMQYIKWGEGYYMNDHKLMYHYCFFDQKTILIVD